MSSREFQVVKRTQGVKQIKPKQNINQVIKTQTKVKNIDSTRTRSPLTIQTAQPASTFVSRRELNHNSLADAKDRNQLPIRTKAEASGRVKNKNEKKIIKYEYKSKNNAKQNSRINTREINSVGKKGNQRYQSYEQQSAFQKRYESSESPMKRRGPLAIGRSGPFNMKKWAFCSKQQINKIIVLQRWWRFLLKNLKKKGNLSKRNDISSKFRSKSSKVSKTVDLTTFMKQAENITEKIFPGQNNKLIIETRKVEVFKINRPKPKKPIHVQSKEAKKHAEKLKSKEEYLQLMEEESDITQKKLGQQFNSLNSERQKRQIIKIKEPKIKGDKRIDSKDGKYGDSSQESKKYGKIRKEGENITEKLFPGENNTLINERRKVEVFKLTQPKSKQDIRVSSKESGRYTGTSKESKKYIDISKEGEKITDKIYPGENSTLINERRKVEIFKINKPTLKEGIRIDSREKRKYGESLKDSKEYIDSTRKGIIITDKSFTDEGSSLISERRKGEAGKLEKPKSKGKFEKSIKEEGRLTEDSKKAKDFNQIEKQGENITEKIFPAGDNNLIIETRKVEVFKNKVSKTKKELPIGSKESKKYGEALKIYEESEEGLKEPGKYGENYKKSKQFFELQKEKGLIKEPRKRGQQGKVKKIQKFVETEGITKKFIKEKMAEIWVEESTSTTTNRLTFKGQGDNRKNIIYGIRDLSSEKRGVSTETDEMNRINNLLTAIKEKEFELNKVVRELKSQMNIKTKTYDTHSAGKISMSGIKKMDKVDSSTNYETKIT